MLKINSKKLFNFKFIDLFAGIGAFRIALESFGAECVFSCEIDKYAIDVYKENFHDMPHGDITTINENDVPDHDILCAGFPCQPFSISGKLNGFKDARGTLFFDIARIIKKKMPKIVFLENVKNFTKHDNGNTLNVVLNILNNLGYSCFYKVLNAKDFGIPQKRERVYFVCFRYDLNIKEFCFPSPIPLTIHVKDLLEDNDLLPAKLFKTRADMQIFNDIDYSNLNRCIRVGIVNKGGQGDRIYSTEGLAITLSANGGGYYAKTGGYLTNRGPRKLTINECKRLMGFPDSFISCKSVQQAYKQFGNSIVVDVLQHIINELLKIVL